MNPPESSGQPGSREGMDKLVNIVLRHVFDYLKVEPATRALPQAEFERMRTEMRGWVSRELWMSRHPDAASALRSAFPPLTKALFETNEAANQAARGKHFSHRALAEPNPEVRSAPAIPAANGMHGGGGEVASSQGEPVPERATGEGSALRTSEAARKPAADSPDHAAAPAASTAPASTANELAALQGGALKPASKAMPASSITRKETYSCKPGKIRVAFREALPEWVSRMRERSVEGLPMGLEIAAGRATIDGMPSEHGEFKVAIKGRTEDGRWIELTVHLPVLPDPRDLWKDVPSDQQGKFAKPDRDSMFDELGGLRLLAASVRGRSHAQKGSYRDDDFYIQRFTSGWIVIATADGAGSAEVSRRGSMLAVKSAAPEFVRMLHEDEAQIISSNGDAESLRAYVAKCAFTATQKAVDAIDNESAREAIPVGQFSTTLILVALRPVGDRWFVGSFGIGDGGAAVWDDSRSRVIPLTKGDSGEFAGQTKFLRRAEVNSFELVKERSLGVLIDRPTAIVAMTDGVTDPKFETDTLFQSVDHWRRFWREDLSPVIARSAAADPVARLLAWMDFWSPGNHDDRTLAIALFDEVK